MAPHRGTDLAADAREPLIGPAAIEQHQTIGMPMHLEMAGGSLCERRVTALRASSSARRPSVTIGGRSTNAK